MKDGASLPSLVCVITGIRLIAVTPLGETDTAVGSQLRPLIIEKTLC